MKVLVPLEFRLAAAEEGAGVQSTCFCFFERILDMAWVDISLSTLCRRW